MSTVHWYERMRVSEIFYVIVKNFLDGYYPSIHPSHPVCHLTLIITWLWNYVECAENLSCQREENNIIESSSVVPISKKIIQFEFHQFRCRLIESAARAAFFFLLLFIFIQILPDDRYCFVFFQRLCGRWAGGGCFEQLRLKSTCWPTECMIAVVNWHGNGSGCWSQVTDQLAASWLAGWLAGLFGWLA